MWNLRRSWIVLFQLQCVTFMLTQGLSTASESLSCPEEFNLYSKLFNGSYDIRQRPGNCSGEPVDIQLSIQLESIITLDEQDEILTASSWVHLDWIDDRLVWEPDEFDGVEYIAPGASSIWTPRLIIDNMAVGPFEDLIGDGVSSVTLTSDGNVYLDFPLIYSTVCQIDISYFPFDIQNCKMLFSAQRTTDTHILLRSGTATGRIGDIFKQWTLGSLSISSYSMSMNTIGRSQRPQTNYSVVEFNIEIQRVPSYHLATNVAPVLILTLLGISIFLIPAESGERLSAGVAVLLGLTFFEFLLCEALPPTTYAPLSGIFWLGSFLIVTLCIFISYISVNMCNYNGSIQGNRKRKVFNVLSRLCCVTSKLSDVNMELDLPSVHNEVFENTAVTRDLSNSGNEDSAVGSTINAVSLRTFQHSDDVTKQDEKQYGSGIEYLSASQVECDKPVISSDYKVATQILDRFFFCITLCAYVLFTAITLSRRP